MGDLGELAAARAVGPGWGERGSSELEKMVAVGEGEEGSHHCGGTVACIRVGANPRSFFPFLATKVISFRN